MDKLPASTRLPEWVPVAALWIFLFGVARSTAHFTYSGTDLTAIAALYAVLGLLLFFTARLPSLLGQWGEFAGAAFVGLVLAWHLREQTRPVGIGDTLWSAAGLLPFLGAALLLAAGYFAIAKLCSATSDRAPRLAVLWGASALVLLLGLGAAFFSSNTLRWHLLQHNKIIGTPAFHLFATPAVRLEEEAWARRLGGAAIRQPDWVLAMMGAASEPGTNRDATGDGERPPDLVFLMLDTLRADALAAYGGDPSLMPGLNRYADESWLFTDVLANSSWTRPSVASFFTGLLPEEHGAIGLQLAISPGVVTLPEVLSNQGYETAAFVSNRRVVNAKAGFARGFDVFEPLINRPYSYATADRVVDRVLDWLAERRGAALATEGGPGTQAPLFLYVHFLDPHTPYLKSSAENPGVSPVDHDLAKRYYDEEVRFLDGELQRLLAALERELDGPRLTLITSDHGEEFGEHGARGHAHTLYSEVLDIPAIVRMRAGAGLSGPGFIDAPLEGRDFFDLLLRSARDRTIDVPNWAQAARREVRVASVSYEKQTAHNATVHYLLRPYQAKIFGRMIQREPFRYIWSAYGATDELYDLADDPAEHTNLAKQRPALARGLASELDALPPYWAWPVPINISPEALDELRALGYVR